MFILSVWRKVGDVCSQSQEYHVAFCAGQLCSQYSYIEVDCAASITYRLVCVYKLIVHEIGTFRYSLIHVTLMMDTAFFYFMAVADGSVSAEGDQSTWF